MRAVTARTSTHGYYHTPRHRWIPLKPTPILFECELTAVFPCLILCGNFVSSTESCRSIYYISRCKDSANRVKYQKKITFSLYFRDAAYLRDICLKDNGKFRLSEKNTYKNAFLSARNLSKSFTHPKPCYFFKDS